MALPQPTLHSLAIEQITARTKIEALDRSIETLKQGLKDLVEETSNDKRELKIHDPLNSSNNNKNVSLIEKFGIEVNIHIYYATKYQ
ncbi:hypothetical protein A4S05_02770 [Nostoc sp. KVJ20]|nr:hypothetical protein A4S05_02770 [Nostoc sp. KVJ20]